MEVLKTGSEVEKSTCSGT